MRKRTAIVMPARKTKRPPSLWPKEHGAYAEMAFPLVTGLALGRPSLVAILLAVACVGAFLAHEPLLVVLGFRGRRTKAELGPAARQHLAWLGGVTLLTGASGLLLAGAATRWAALAPAGLALLMLPLVVTRREKSALGEALVAAAFSAGLLPVALASGVAWPVAVTAAVIWVAVFLLGTFIVRLTLERARKERGPMRIVSPLACLVALGGAGAAAVEIGLAPIAVIPTALAGLGLWLRPVSAKRLKVMGWSLVGGSLLAFALILMGLR